MNQPVDRKELERRLAQCLRLADQASDALTKNRLTQLVRDLEDQLKKADIAQGKP